MIDFESLWSFADIDEREKTYMIKINRNEKWR
ncbi:hypothetical protein Xedl_01607 [Xenorhabdus eapokensis]|uniref:Uncharacterized protein n=1 Tax=Xenorhabdus eapokensis TaxID=1873482 RepID=A0A1Q5TTS8_9GAMM|nr:hypothetical protein Xedl_01607 [Xenorhabdus eapokensis]